jgi:mannosyltransferase OCH1-like enzyme
MNLNTDLSLDENINKERNEKLRQINIPKIIHQTWKNYDIPEKWKESPEAIKKYFPDWEYKLWSDEDMDTFVHENYNWFYSTYKNYRYHIQRCDVFRYIILYHFGGLYMDLDIVPTSNFEHLFTDVDAEVYLPKTPNVESYTNCILASKPNSRYWLHLFEILIENSKKRYYSRYFEIIFSSGPRALSKAVDTYHHPICVLPKSIISQDVTNPNKKCLIYTKALKGQSWLDWEGKLITTVYAKRQYIFILFLSLLCYHVYLFFIYRSFYINNN